jgi:3',5'-cyclic AMP phosphodiesterase CpdA
MQRRGLLKSLGLITGGLVLPKEILAKEAPKNKSIRIAHITDTHIQPYIGAAKGFEKCLHHIQNLERKVDFVVNGGDAIMGTHHASENSIGKQWELYKKVIGSENHLPVYNCIGNHDIYRKKDDLQGFEDGKKVSMDHLEMSKTYYAFNAANWKVIVLDSVQGKLNLKGYQGKIDEEQMDWLKNQLKETPKETYILIVSHIPILSACVFLDGKNFKNGEWRVPETWMHSDTEDLVELFANYPNIKLAISGHIHLTDKIEYNQITYCCNGAVSGNWWMGNYKQTKPGYAVIDLYENGTFENMYLCYS